MNPSILLASSLTFSEWLKSKGLAGRYGSEVLDQYGVHIIVITGILGIATLTLRIIGSGVRSRSRKDKSDLSAHQKFWLFRALIGLAFTSVFFAFISLTLFQVYYSSVKAASPSPPDTPKAEKGSVPDVTKPTVPNAQPEYKLVWYNHLEPTKLYEVTRTDTNRADVGNAEFKSWCRELNLAQWEVLSVEQVAGDEQYKSVPNRSADNWWIAEPYNLPRLLQRWLKIMDDERWYVYKVVPLAH